MAKKLLQTKSTATTYGISSSSTTIQLKKLLKLDGTSVSASDIGDLLYGTFAPGTSREEIFSIVGANVTIETNGNVSITNVVRGLKEVDPYTSGGYSCDHPAGEVVVFGNNPQVYDDIYDYINGIAIAGSPDATATTKGIGKVSVAPVSPTNPIFVGDNDPRIPTTDETAAMDGTQGVPSATNKYVTSDNVYTAETDQTQATQNGTVEFGEANSTTKKLLIAQSFIPTKTKIRGIKLYKIANTGTFTGDVTVALFADSAGSPTGSALATVTITNSAYNTLAVGEFEAIFSSEYSMTVGTLYWFKVSTTTADSSNHPNLGTNTAGGYANGSVKYFNGTDGYVAIATIDLYFKTLNGEKSQIVQTDTSGDIPLTCFNPSKMPIPVYQQAITSTVTTSTMTGGQASGSNSDGSVIYIFEENQKLRRYARESISGSYNRTHLVNTTFALRSNANNYGSIIVIGQYIYVFSSNGTSMICSRFSATDLTGEQAMTIPTVTSGTSVMAWTDGENAYVATENAISTSRKWSISGTTMTAVTTGTMSASLTALNGGTWIGNTSSFFDGTNVYISSAGISSGMQVLRLNDFFGTTTTDKIVTLSGGYVINGSPSGISVSASIDATRMYIGNIVGIHNATAQYTANIIIIPITKP